MKLVLCMLCYDVFKLDEELRKCKCGQCEGRYLNHIDAEYKGKHAVPLGFANSSLIRSVSQQPSSGNGKEFTAFVIPKDCPTMRYDEAQEVAYTAYTIPNPGGDVIPELIVSDEGICTKCHSKWTVQDGCLNPKCPEIVYRGIDK